MAKNKKSLQSIQDMSLSNLIGMYALAAIAVAGFVGYFLIMPLLGSAQETQDEIELVEAEIDGLEKLIADTETMRENYEEIKQDRDQILSLLPRENEEEYLLALINQTASRNGIVVSSYRPEVGFESGPQQDASGSHRIYKAEVTISGTHGQLTEFLDDLESSSRFVFVTEILASTGSNIRVSNPDISTTMSIEAYYQPETKSASGNTESGSMQTGGESE